LKAELRQQIQPVIRGISAEQRAALSGQLCQVLLNDPHWIVARSILFFAPLRDEPDIAPALEAAFHQQKEALLPRFQAHSGTYVACQVQSRIDLVRGQFGILEPAAACAVVALNHLDLVLVPGIAFDFAGRRLGRGKGFYDRLLAEVRGHKCGVCFDQQIVPTVPVEPHDIRLDSILTPTRWHLCQRAA
jgi:5-formyltetrahydrofolate cyclo-ligase